MRKDIHPELHLVTASCACGNTFETYSTKEELRLEICNACHPFFTGKQKFVDTAGRVQKFRERYGNYRKKPAEAEAAPADQAETPAS